MQDSPANPPSGTRAKSFRGAGGHFYRNAFVQAPSPRPRGRPMLSYRNGGVQ